MEFDNPNRIWRTADFLEPCDKDISNLNPSELRFIIFLLQFLASFSIIFIYPAPPPPHPSLFYKRMDGQSNLLQDCFPFQAVRCPFTAATAAFLLQWKDIIQPALQPTTAGQWATDHLESESGGKKSTFSHGNADVLLPGWTLSVGKRLDPSWRLQYRSWSSGWCVWTAIKATHWTRPQYLELCF